MSLLVDRYADLLNRAQVSERPLFALPKIPGELELQARWFAGDFGRKFHSTSGATVEIVQFGFWNREAGPDFKDAAIRLDGEVLRGPIEIDLLDRNWELHGHGSNSAFNETILHLFVERSSAEFFTRTRAHRSVAQVQLDLGALANVSSPAAALAHPGRCVAPLQNLEPARVESVLAAAAQFRLRKKAQRLQQRIDVHGRDEAIFQAIAEALGYKQNRLPLILLAQRLSLETLRKQADHGEALLFGVAGFLDALELAAGRNVTGSYLRALWDEWWKHRDRFQRLMLPAKLWKSSGTRPLNSPQRRLGALVALIAQWRDFSRLTRNGTTAEIVSFLVSLQHEFWSYHYTLAAPRSPAPMALIGPARAADILANVVLPLRLANGEEVWSDYKKLRAQLSNRALKIAATRLFATDPRQTSFLRRLAGQQGLLQIYEDFCLRDATDCAQCPFPEQMRNW